MIHAAALKRGAIPACAGEPAGELVPHPHEKGDPRVRGGAYTIGGTLQCSQGRSPRARGSRSPAGREAGREGAIPACAGEPVRRSRAGRPEKGDPRVRGGAVYAIRNHEGKWGRSPRARGSPKPGGGRRDGAGAIPACAGEPASSAQAPRRSRGDPRVRGGAGDRRALRTFDKGRSPRARGSRRHDHCLDRPYGAIPACAGEPRSRRTEVSSTRGDPRVRGGATRGSRGGSTSPGRSPRARGSQPAVARVQVRLGAIPACAGEPSYRRRQRVPSRGDPRVRGGAPD